MSFLPDALLISELNIPGSHNAAAINTIKRTRWACQDRSITAQLAGGIRLLDIRLKPKKRRKNDYFVTCHGHLGLLGANEFQPLDQLLAACTAFLQATPGETLLMTIKMDDWRRTRPTDRPAILETLKTHLAHLPILRVPQSPLPPDDPLIVHRPSLAPAHLPTLAPAHLPTLSECRGKIYLINRINDDPALGVPLNIPDNTPGTLLPPTAHRHYAIYVQDQYKALNRKDPEAHKLHLTMAATKHKHPGTVLLNFVSATKPFGRFVYITPPIPDQPAALGWLFLDYAFTTHDSGRPATADPPATAGCPATADLPARIIASNFAAAAIDDAIE